MNQFILRWQHLPEDIDPVFLSLGAFQIRYYGLMYLCSFLVFYALALYRVKNEKTLYTKEHIDDYLSWAIIGVLLGGRLGYVLFYNLNYYLANPAEVFWPVHHIGGQTYFGISGLSYHGGVIGALIATAWFSHRKKFKLPHFIDFIIPAVPLGYMFGRIGNFLNSELYGRVTASQWGMYFPTAPSYELRHPSQLYEGFFEGFVLFLLLWSWRKKKMFPGALLAIYFMGYSFVRFFIEYLREPDSHIGYLAARLSMGQLLSLVMFLFGLFIYCRCKSRKENYGAENI